MFQSEGYRPHAASTYLTDHLGSTPTGSSMGGIYSVDQGREIGFTSSQLPLTKYTFAEDTESQYADELRRQAYIQTLGKQGLIICSLEKLQRCEGGGVSKKKGSGGKRNMKKKKVGIDHKGRQEGR